RRRSRRQGAAPLETETARTAPSGTASCSDPAPHRGAVAHAARSSAAALHPKFKGVAMKIDVIVHDAEEGGYWAEVPSMPGCATEGDTFEELLQNLYEAIAGCLNVEIN